MNEFSDLKLISGNTVKKGEEVILSSCGNIALFNVLLLQVLESMGYKISTVEYALLAQSIIVLVNYPEKKL